MLKRIISISLAVLMGVMFAGCSATNEPAPAPADNTAHTNYINKPGESAPLSIRITDSEIMSASEYKVSYTNANNDFAVIMTNAMEDGWTGVYSPLSLQIALQVLAMGGDEATSEELLNELCPGMTRADVNASTARLIDMLMKSKGVTINSAVISNNAYQVCEQFANDAANYYLASVGALDFGDPQKALAEINGWIEKNTDGLVKDLLDRVGHDTALVILNALTLKLNWKTPFSALREFIEFTNYKGETEPAPAMKLAADLEYGKFDEGQMVILPYEGDEYAMALILPAEGVTPREAAAALIGRYGECSEMSVSVKMPKVEIDTRLDVLGMADKLNIANGINGKFTNLIGEDVSITVIKQGAYLSVTESGTTAAAATAVVASKGIVLTEADLVIDRPFAMVIYHVETGAVLFVSLVNSVGVSADSGK
jgi:serpin B